eukprot:Hpha_TRINITY_DN15724_c5_g4::TRINITY_DN15724_c5_g4_i1::g.40343::m.40343/K01057/PGLS, pgl, devB; 6-phosphogluconolactonase
MPPKVVVSDSKAAVAAELSGFVLSAAAEAIAARGRFTVALSGGSLPSILAEGLAQAESQWDKWHVLFADERFVPLDHSDSNYKACKEALFSKVPIPDSQIYPIDAAAGSVQEAAQRYEGTLRKVCTDPAEADSAPKVDLLLLGMGPDGHTLSLFPGHSLAKDEKSLVGAITDSPKPPPERITLMLKVCQDAGGVAFVVTGDKAPAARRAIEPAAGEDALDTPARIVSEKSRQAVWFLDKNAAAQLSKL